MDANGHRFWMLGEGGDFDLSDGSCQFSGGCLQLSGSLRLGDQAGARSDAISGSNLPPVTVGHFDDWAWYDETREYDGAPGAIVGATNGGAPLPIFGVPAGAEIRDLAVDEDGLLRIAGKISEEANGLIIADLRQRWREPVVIPAGQDADRVAGRWLLERKTGRLWREAGVGLADLALRSYSDNVFRPDPEYTNPLRLEEQDLIETLASERILDCAARSDGMLAVLVISASATRRTRILFIPPKGSRVLLDVPIAGFAGSIGFVSDRQVALCYPGTKRAVVLDIGGEDPVELSVEPNRYPLTAAENMRICRGTRRPIAAVCYGEDDRPAGAPKPLFPLSMPGYRNEGIAPAAWPVRSESRETTWHRLVVEGDFPAGTGAEIGLRVADREEDLPAAPEHWHYVGDVTAREGAPKLGWFSERSEIALHPGLLGRDSVPNRTGCFSCLVQNTRFVSREVVGRFAALRVRLRGTGQATPSIAAVRLYGSRFSLVKAYLPEVMRPPVDPAMRRTEGDAHTLDFYDRYTANFEALLTRLEDKVVAAPALTDPMAAPEEALDWLAGWIGLIMKNGLNERQRRVMLANGMRLHRRRGTMAGLRLALDIASEGEVSAGGIVALEDFRLRRVFATILGADLGARFDPLVAGEVESGNSFVGPTLHLGDADETDLETGQPRLSEEQLTEIAALYSAPTEEAALEAVREFFAQLAWRVTVLVHADIDETRLGLIRDVAQQMTPGHVKLRVERATRSLILGLYGLLGVDTYLKPRPGAEPTILDRTVLGEKDLILSLPSLDPSADYGGSP